MEKIDPENLHRLADLLHHAQQHHTHHCACPTLDGTCGSCDLRMDANAALDAYYAWCGETAVVLTRLVESLDSQRTRMERQAATEDGCAECDDHAPIIADELARPDAQDERRAGS